MFIKFCIGYLVIALIVFLATMLLAGEFEWYKFWNAVKAGLAWPIVLVIFVWMLIIDGVES